MLLSESKEIPLQTEYIQEALCEELQEPGIEDSDTIEQVGCSYITSIV